MKGKRWVVIAAVVLACAGTLQRVHPQPPEKGGRGALTGAPGRFCCRSRGPARCPGAFPFRNAGFGLERCEADQVHDLGKTPSATAAYVAGECTVTGTKPELRHGGGSILVHLNGAMRSSRSS